MKDPKLKSTSVANILIRSNKSMIVGLIYKGMAIKESDNGYQSIQRIIMH